MRSRLVLAAVIGSVVVAALGGSAGAAAAAHWPGHVVRYADYSRSTWDVRTAVALWNQVQTGVHLVPARRGQRPQIRIFAAGCPSGLSIEIRGGACGLYPPDGRAYLGERTDDGGEGFGLLIASHEIGHALGLGHAPGCRVMVPDFHQFDCRGHPWDACGPTRADALALVHLYGGHARRFDRRSRGCFSFLPPAPRARGTLVSPSGPVDAPPEQRDQVLPPGVDVQIRNDSSWTWGRDVFGPVATDDVALVTVDEHGAPTSVPDNCNPGETIGRPVVRVADHPVRPGSVGTFRLFVCPPVADQTIHLRLYSVSPGAQELPSPPIFTVRIRGSMGPPGPPPDQSPVAAFNAQPMGNGVVAFQSTSYDPDGHIVAWQWDFGDPDSPDNSSTAENPTHTYSTSGTFTVTLYVTDDSGSTGFTSQSVTP